MRLPGHYVNTIGAISEVPCANGTYQSLRGQTSCVDADPGHYVDTPGQENQTACCLIGTYQPGRVKPIV